MNIICDKNFYQNLFYGEIRLADLSDHNLILVLPCVTELLTSPTWTSNFDYMTKQLKYVVENSADEWRTLEPAEIILRSQEIDNSPVMVHEYEKELIHDLIIGAKGGKPKELVLKQLERNDIIENMYVPAITDVLVHLKKTKTFKLKVPDTPFINQPQKVQELYIDYASKYFNLLAIKFMEIRENRKGFTLNRNIEIADFPLALKFFAAYMKVRSEGTPSTNDQYDFLYPFYIWNIDSDAIGTKDKIIVQILKTELNKPHNLIEFPVT